MNQRDHMIKQLASLLGDDDFQSELKAFKRAFHRLRVRLRNNPLIAKLKQLVTLMHHLRVNYQPKILLSYSERINRRQQQSSQSSKALEKFVAQLVYFLDGIIEKTFHSYCYTQCHLKVGHLIHHFIFIRSSLARLRVIFKAALVYSCDLYLEIIEDQSERDRIKVILAKNEIKPRYEPKASTSNTESVKNKDKSTLGGYEEVGQLISRETMKPI